MKRILCLALSVLMVLTMFAGCGSDTASTETQDASTEPATEDTASPEQSASAGTLSGTISTNGSTSMDGVINALIEAFTAENPDVTITYDPTGSGSGITAASEGTADIGLSSRALHDDETGLDATVIALDGIAIIVNNENPVEDLSLEEIAGLVTGQITNWSEVGGNDAPVTVIGREAGSGTRDGFESIVGVEDACVYDQELTSTGAVIAAVAANEYAIGYASLSAVSDEVKAVTVDGVAASEETVLDGTYAIQRPFVLVTKSGESNELVQAFIDFALSSDATDIIANAGAVQAQADSGQTAAAESETAAEPLSGTISTNGSTSMDGVINALIEAFTAENPDVTITYDPTGSGSGITAASEGTADIGLSSRALHDDETGLDATVIALDGIAIIVNNENPVEDLSLEEIAGLVTGQITNWSEVGGNDAPVTVIGREAGSGTRDGFESIVGVEDACVYDQELTSTGAVIAAVAANEYAIGYASLSAVSDEVKAVTVDGVAASEETVLDGTYAIQRPFVLVTKSGESNELVQAFIDFALSSDAAGIIANAGAVQAQ